MRRKIAKYETYKSFLTALAIYLVTRAKELIERGEYLWAILFLCGSIAILLYVYYTNTRFILKVVKTYVTEQR